MFPKNIPYEGRNLTCNNGATGDGDPLSLLAAHSKVGEREFIVHVIDRKGIFG
jgi:hypothetical protein